AARGDERRHIERGDEGQQFFHAVLVCSLRMRRAQRAAVRSVTTFGVRKIRSSVFAEEVVRVLKRLPRYGTSPSHGTLVMSSRSCCSKMPPITTVPPFSTRTCVLTCLVLIAKPAVVARPTLSLVMSTSRMTLPSGVICGVTSSLRLALRNCSDVAPLEVATWYGSSSPCSISAFCWSAVMTRGLETTLPLPSASSAEISRLRKRFDDAPNNDSAKLAGSKPLAPVAGRLTKVVSAKLTLVVPFCRVVEPMAFMLPPTA